MINSFADRNPLYAGVASGRPSNSSRQLNVTVNTKPEPLFPSLPRPRCPVCGTASYSREGIHPQCAMRAADGANDRRLSIARKEAIASPPPAVRRFERVCPRCQAVQHVRRRTCECGHVL